MSSASSDSALVAPGAAPLPVVEVFTDGACNPNPGVGGWAAILIAPGRKHARKEIFGADPQSTNNRMELTAAQQALCALKQPCRVELHTDSRYLCDAFGQGWLAKWKRNGWKTAAGKPVLNQDLWLELDRLTQVHDVHWHWIRGHADHPENERCDELAVAARMRLQSEAELRLDGGI